MKKDGELNPHKQKIEKLINELHKFDCWIDFEKLREIVSYGNAIVPYLEKIISNALKKRAKFNLKAPPKDTDWFIVVHALYLLAQLRSEKSLDLVLEFLSQTQEYLDYWLHDLLIDDIWEVVYYLGRNQPNKLEAFVLNQNNSVFARLSVCTALIQISTRHKSKKEEITRIFKNVLASENEDPDFIGLLASELLDIKDECLRSSILRALKQQNVWPGIISAEEVKLLYENKKVRTLKPLDIFQRYEYFRQDAYFAQTSPLKPLIKKKVRKLKDHS
jgi:hypothetical protein